MFAKIEQFIKVICERGGKFAKIEQFIQVICERITKAGVAKISVCL